MTSLTLIRRAVAHTLHRIERGIPESKQRAQWEQQIRQLLADTVAAFEWEEWHQVIANTPLEQLASMKVPPEVAAKLGKLPDLVQALWDDAARFRADLLGLPFQPDELHAALSQAFRLVKTLPDTQVEALRTLMGDALKGSDGPAGFARTIRAEWPNVARWKANQIAVTEWNRAASGATWLGYQRQGVAYKEWNVGPNPCPECEDNESAGAILIEDTFPSGDQFPPAHPVCECNISSSGGPEEG